MAALLVFTVSCGAPAPSTTLTCHETSSADCTQAYHIAALAHGKESMAAGGAVVARVACDSLSGFASSGYPPTTECWLVTMGPADPAAGTKFPVLRVPGGSMTAGRRGPNLP